MPALLALHIESALDPSETDLVHAMARISINQTMLLLREAQEIPAIKRALPVFEDVLSKKNLLVLAPSQNEQPPLPTPSDQTQQASPHPDLNMAAGQEEHVSMYGDVLGFDFLDGWQIEQLDFTGMY